MFLKKLLVEPPDEDLGLDLEILKKAGEGESFSQLDVGKAYYSTSNLKGNCEKAFHWLMLSAEQKNTEAQFRLGDLYASGQGVEKSEFTAYEWYLKSALQGYPKALTRIHNLYNIEKGMYCRGQRDSKEAEWASADFKKKNNIRELNEYRVQQLESELTKIKDYFSQLLADCREQVDDDDKEDKQDAYLKLGFLYQHGYGIRKIKSRAIEFYTLASEKGNIDAAYNLGHIYHHSPRMKWNYREAFKWYTKAVENGHVYAHDGLAFLYLKGLGTGINSLKAIQLYTKAADNRHVNAMISLAIIFRKGEIIEQNYETAAEWYRKAMAEGSTVAQNSLELLYANKKLSDTDNGLHLEKKYSRVHSKRSLCSKLRSDALKLNNNESDDLEKLKLLALNAVKGDGHAMLKIGMMYYNGDGFVQDKDIAFRWIRNAAKSGLTNVQCTIAKMFKNGDYIKQNYHKASVWYEKAAKKGDINARYNLGSMYHNGLGVRKDPLEASKWYTFAADKNNSDAQYQLGLLRLYGEGLRQDMSDALELLNVSAKQKNPQAVYRLAIIYEFGNGVKSDFELALNLFAKAAQLGSLDAHLKLAGIYNNEKIQYHDKKTASKYYKIASDKGSAEAKYKLAAMYLHGQGVDQDLIQAYHLFKESSVLGCDKSANIFNTPIDYLKSNDINYHIVIEMFELVCKNGIDSLEYNLGFHYSNDAMFEHNLQAHFEKAKNTLRETWYELASEKGIHEAQYAIAITYEKRNDISKAVEYYEKAYTLGNIDATYKLARMHLDGYGVSQNYQKSFYLFNEAYEKGHKGAYRILSSSEVDYQSENYESIKKMLQILAESGNVICQYKLGMLILNNKSSSCGIQEAIKWLGLASEGGFINASYQLAFLLDSSSEEEKDYQEIVSLYQLAADKGHEEALFKLAHLYHVGERVDQDYLKAFKFYYLAARQEYPPAQVAINVTGETIWEANRKRLNKNLEILCLAYTSYFDMWKHVAGNENIDLQYKLGIIYENNGEKADIIQAVKWYSKAASGSHSNALYRLGRLYEKGLGVNQDYSAAVECYEKASKLNNDKALYQLGAIYYDSVEVETDIEKAFYYYKNAAKKGNTMAQFALGKLHENGIFMTQDYLEALKWYSISACRGNLDAENWLLTHYDEVYNFELFYHRKLTILYKSALRAKTVKRGKHIYYPKDSFLGSTNYKLGLMYYHGYGTTVNYINAYNRFYNSATLHGDIRAKEKLSIKYENISISTKDNYLKKLKMFEAVAREYSVKNKQSMETTMEQFSTKDVHKCEKLLEQLSFEDIYELGSIYYHGVYSNANYSQVDKTEVIVAPDLRKASAFFKMITKTDFPDVHDYYMFSSYYMGMLHFINVKRINDSSKAKYYLTNTLTAGFSDCQPFLNYINTDKSIEAVVFEKVLKWHEKTSDPNNIRVAYNIGYMYCEGLGTGQNYTKSIQYYKIAADQGHSNAQNQLGTMYENGVEVSQNYATAIDWYTKAASQNHIFANYNLGRIYYYGQGVEKDYKLAFLHHKAAADQGDSDAQNSLGVMYGMGYGVEQNDTKAIEWCTKAADQNNKLANFNLGAIYYFGLGVEINYRLAFHHYKVAADQGHSNAQNQLGTMYENGVGVSQNYATAIDWYTKAASQNHIFANYNLGRIYYYGQGVEKDYKLALCYFKAAADQEDSNAQNQLGVMYQNGDGVDQNYAAAIEWYTKAANQNNAIANYNLGQIYYYGQGVEKDYKLAFQYFKVASDQGDSDAHIKLGIMYSLGLGIEANYDIAASMFAQASSKKDAIIELGEKYHSINNEFQDFSKAFECYKQVDEDDSNRSHALRGIGLLYEYGDGVEKNYEIAFDYYRKSAEKENKGAYYNMALLYYYGKGVEKDYDIALEWFNRVIAEKPREGCTYVFVQDENDTESDLQAIEQRKYSMVFESVIYGEAYYYLGLMHKEGQGTDKSHEKSIDHFKIASANGVERAQKHLDIEV